MTSYSTILAVHSLTECIATEEELYLLVSIVTDVTLSTRVTCVIAVSVNLEWGEMSNYGPSNTL